MKTIKLTDKEAEYTAYWLKTLLASDSFELYDKAEKEALESVIKKLES